MEWNGWRNTVKTRQYAVEHLKFHISNKTLQIPDKATVEEMMQFVYVPKSGDYSNPKPQAARKGQPPTGGDTTGLHDDRVFSLMGAMLAHSSDSLDLPQTPREKRIEKEQTDHDMLYPEWGEAEEGFSYEGLEHFDYE